MAEAADGRHRPMALLVAEDVDYNARVIQAVLESEGHRVVLAGTGIEAVAAAAEGDFDAILMDIVMPEMDGIEATRRIRQLPDESRARVPIIGLTADPEPRADYRAAGLDHLLGKPLDLHALSRTVALVAGTVLGTDASGPATRHADNAFDHAWIAEMLRVLPYPQLVDLVTQAKRAMAEHLGEIEARLAAGDAVRLADAAHRLAGLAAMHGCNGLRAASLSLEDAARSGGLEKVGHRMASLRGAVGQSVAALEQALRVPGGPALAALSEGPAGPRRNGPGHRP